MVKESASVNVAEFVGLHNGTVHVPTFDWATYLEQFYKKLPNIKSYYHFRFDQEFPGTVFCKQYWFSEEKAINLLRNRNQLPQPAQLPNIVPKASVGSVWSIFIKKSESSVATEPKIWLLRLFQIKNLFTLL